MQSTTNYGLNIVEGTDIVNPLTQFNPNFTQIDSIMKDNADASIDHATCIKTGAVHAVTRTNPGASVFRFTATGNWNAGDTMTVDGTLVSVYVSDGTAPAAGCFIINSEVLASIQGTRVTLYVNSGDASNIAYNNASSGLSATDIQDAIDELASGVDSAETGANHKAGDIINLTDFVATGFLRGNRKRVDFAVPLCKDIGSLTPAITGNWTFFDVANNNILVSDEDINATGNTVSIVKRTDYLFVQISKPDNIATSQMGAIYLSNDCKITLS